MADTFILFKYDSKQKWHIRDCFQSFQSSCGALDYELWGIYPVADTIKLNGINELNQERVCKNCLRIYQSDVRKRERYRK